MVKLNEYLTVKHGLLPKGEKDAIICFRPSLDKDEYFELDFLYDSPKRRKIKGALFSVSKGRNQRYYARIDIESRPEPWSIKFDLPRRLVDTVLSHLEAYKQRLDAPLWEASGVMFYKELAEYVEQAIRKEFKVPPPERPPDPSKRKIIPLRKK